MYFQKEQQFQLQVEGLQSEHKSNLFPQKCTGKRKQSQKCIKMVKDGFQLINPSFHPLLSIRPNWVRLTSIMCAVCNFLVRSLLSPKKLDSFSANQRVALAFTFTFCKNVLDSFILSLSFSRKKGRLKRKVGIRAWPKFGVNHNFLKKYISDTSDLHFLGNQVRL